MEEVLEQARRSSVLLQQDDQRISLGDAAAEQLFGGKRRRLAFVLIGPEVLPSSVFQFDLFTDPLGIQAPPTPTDVPPSPVVIPPTIPPQFQVRLPEKRRMHDEVGSPTQKRVMLKYNAFSLILR